jgi:hypothetical protein
MVPPNLEVRWVCLEILLHRILGDYIMARGDIKQVGADTTDLPLYLIRNSCEATPIQSAMACPIMQTHYLFSSMKVKHLKAFPHA